MRRGRTSRGCTPPPRPPRPTCVPSPGWWRPTSSPVEVVDRPRWVRANVDGFGVVLDPVEERLLTRAPGPAVQAVGSTLTALETGAVLAWLAARVLGQFEIAGRAATAPSTRAGCCSWRPTSCRRSGRSRLDAADFRLWVCLHEETHRVQFGGVPWMRGHLLGEMRGIIGSLETEPGQWVGRMAAIVRAIGSALIGRGAGGSGRRGPAAGAAGAAHPTRRDHDPARGPRRLRHGRGRPAGRPLGRADPVGLRRPPGQRGPGRGRDAPPARDGREDAAVPRGGGVRPRRRLPRRSRRVHRGLVRAGDPAVPRRDRRTPSGGWPGCTARRPSWAPADGGRPCATTSRPRWPRSG